MISIISARKNDFKLLADIGKQSFIESHGESASKADIDSYVSEKYTNEIFQKELDDKNNIYHFIYFNDQPAGYSKIILNNPQTDIEQKNITKLERLYLLKEFYDRKLGVELFNFNVQLSKKNNQSGIWLFVWKGNKRAVNFYTRNSFKIIGSYDFKISETHSNPNHKMFLKF